MAAVTLEHALAPQPLRVTAAGRRSLRAWNSQPCSPSPRSPSPPPCGRTWAVRASSTERGKALMACCDRCGHPFIKQQLRVTLSEHSPARTENARCVSDPKAVHWRRVPGSGRFSNVLLQGLNGPATPRSRRCHWAWWPCLAVPSAVQRRPRPRTSTFARPAPTWARVVWT